MQGDTGRCDLHEVGGRGGEEVLELAAALGVVDRVHDHEPHVGREAAEGDRPRVQDAVARAVLPRAMVARPLTTRALTTGGARPA